MSLHYFEGDLIEENVFSFMKEFLSKLGEDNVIYFSSPGGNPSVAYVLADSLWRVAKNNINITLVFYDEIHSACFLFLHYLCRVKEGRKKSDLRSHGDEIKFVFLKDAYCVLHTVTHGYDKEEDRDAYEIETIRVKNLNTLLLNYYAKKITKSEKDLFKRNKEVLFTSERLQNLFGGVIVNQFE